MTTVSPMPRQPSPEPRHVRRRGTSAAVAFAMLFPSVITWLYFVAMANSGSVWQQGCYLVGKCLQFGFPIAWVVFVLRERPSRPRLSRQQLAQPSLKWAIVFGLVVTSAGYVAYVAFLRPSGFLDSAQAAVEAKVSGMGIHSVWQYLGVAVFYSVFHSLLEEYYWRWFVFGQLRRLTSLKPAVLLSAAGFAAHHVIVLAQFFGGLTSATLILSFGVAVGGAFWAIFYERGRSLLSPWLSHLLVDAGIFLIGFDLIRSSLTAW